MGEYLALSNVKITNYVPKEGREALKGDINITNNEKGIFELEEGAHQRIMDKLQTLDGVVDSLSTDDIKLAKSMEGFEGITKIFLDTINNVVRFVLNDGTNLRVDMNIDNQPALKSIQNEIANGNAEYKSGVLNYITQCLTPHYYLKGDVIVLNSLPREGMTLGEVKEYFHLPDGCLKNNVMQGGGNLDNYKAVAPIDIHVATLAKRIGVTPEQIKAIFMRNEEK